MLAELREKLAGSMAQPLYAAQSMSVALIGPLLVIVAPEPPDEREAQVAARWADRLLASYPRRGGLLVVVQASSAAPDELERQYMHRMLTTFGRAVAVGAAVIEGSGFRAATKRSVLSLLLVRSPYPFAFKVFQTVAEAAPFVCERLPPEHPVEASRVLASIEQLRAAYDGALAAPRQHG